MGGCQNYGIISLPWRLPATLLTTSILLVLQGGGEE